ncbi:hypothetical protein AXF42_Ash014295 [Apostasia shenzhenica]|uniref:Uncharacterized protein n=1 Tax=Apostasia shenzhenica TaxID=1088818 RepID=A0A2I0B0S6_9ASPA|nr:hypothetical protein AXF42_Ash014295 [Apostasia shenzhenica]
MGASSGRLLLSHMPAAAVAAAVVLLLLLVFAAAPAARASRISPSEKEALKGSRLAVTAFNRRKL